MELQAFAEQVLLSESLEQKLRPPELPLTDESRGDARQPPEPGRPPSLKFAPRRTAPPMPKPGAFADARKRGLAHHILANHELQALEVMADVLLRFPEAPAEFRFGMVEIMQDEQRHTRMHVERAAVLGVEFGSMPVNSYIWKKARDFNSLLDYLATLPLLFEGRNLDHTLEFASYFDAVGDTRSAALMRVIHRDEIEHVRFGIDWLRRLKNEDETEWEAFQNHLKWPLRPAKAKGTEFQREARLEAGLSASFVDNLIAATDDDAATGLDDEESHGTLQ